MMETTKRKLRWLPLDNAAKIYPAARNRKWSNVFRLSVTLKEQIDPVVLQSALDVTAKRFPSMAVRLRRGVFWYYLQELDRPPRIRQENSYPLAHMGRDEVRRCALRVIVYGKRIAVEFFHSVTDGNGALIFLKTLTAEYLLQKYGAVIPAQMGVLDRQEAPREEELEDSFQRCSGPVAALWEGKDAWRIGGTKEDGAFIHLTCFRLPVRRVLEAAHEWGVTATVFLSAVMLMALQNMQAEAIRDVRRRKRLKLHVPVNLRPIFGSQTLRNFVLYTTPGIDPRLGRYEFREICDIVRHTMGLETTAKHMSRMIAGNISSERNMAVKVMPLFIKNAVMKAVFSMVGERKSCLSLSNLGLVRMPEEMAKYVDRIDFILGVQAKAPYNCGVVSFGDTVYVNFVRNVRESTLERHFYQVLRQLGIPATVESNGANERSE